MNQRSGRIRTGMRMSQRRQQRIRVHTRERIILSSSFIVTLSLGLLLFITVSYNRETFADGNGGSAATKLSNQYSEGTIITYHETNWETSSYAIETVPSLCQTECCDENENEPTGCSGIEINVEINFSAGINNTAIRLNKQLQLNNN